MTLSRKDTAALQAFWRKSRNGYVPLTGEEWERATSTDRRTRRRLTGAGVVDVVKLDRRNSVFQITPAGIAALQEARA